MKCKDSAGRRDFIRKSIMGATGLMAASSGINVVFSQQEKSGSRGIEINPFISNLKVAYIEDRTMLSDGFNTAFGSFSESNTKVDGNRVRYSLDLLSWALAKESDPDKSWKKVFQKPEAKNWNQVKVAIKPNCAAGNTDGQQNPHASIAIMNTLCERLTVIGVLAENITIYDTSGFSVHPASLYPAHLMYPGIQFLGPVSGNYPSPLWSAVSRAALEADIIINIASCKGHAELGGATLTLKNHLGTVGGHVSGATAIKKTIDIHNSEAVLGKPVSGSVPPKQQLAIVDCLWSAKDGPLAPPDKAPCMIVMGTSCPAVDCFTAIKVRLEKLKYPGNRNTFVSYLTEYGYDAATEIEPLLNSTTHPWETKGWVDAAQWNPGTPIKGTNSLSNNFTVTFTITGSAFKPHTKKITLKQGEHIQSISITNIKGRVIQTFSLDDANRNCVFWDGRNSMGKPVSAGTYIIRITGVQATKAVRFCLSK